MTESEEGMHKYYRAARALQALLSRHFNFHAIIFRSILMLSFDHYEIRSSEASRSLPCQHHIIAARGHVM